MVEGEVDVMQWGVRRGEGEGVWLHERDRMKPCPMRNDKLVPITEGSFWLGADFPVGHAGVSRRKVPVGIVVAGRMVLSFAWFP